ncbi:MAG: phosphoserine phosphatase SerB [Paracoccaceae bacterium]
MDELIGIITKEDFLDDDLIKDVLFILGGRYPLRLGEAGCQFSICNKFSFSDLNIVRTMKVDVNILSKINREKQILVADMDSTLIKEECIDELAKFTGVSEKILEITNRSMNGKILFSDSFIKRTELFKGVKTDILEDCFNQCINISRGAKTLINTMNTRNARTYIISGGYNFFVGRVAKLLKVSGYYSNDAIIQNNMFSGKVKQPIIDEKAKLDLVKKICKKSNLNLKNVIAVGDGANDIKMLESVGHGIAFKSKKIVKSYTDIHIDYSDLTSLLFLQGINQKYFVRK